MTRWLPLIVLVLTACGTSLSDVRQESPAKRVSFPGSAVSLSRCAMNHFEDAGTVFSFHLRDDPTTQTTTISATRQVTFARSPFAGLEYRFHQLEPSTVQVELRQGWPDGGWLSERTWPLIEACARAPA